MTYAILGALFLIAFAAGVVFHKHIVAVADKAKADATSAVTGVEGRVTAIEDAARGTQKP